MIRLARTASPDSAMADATDSLATARASTAGLWPNPSLDWDREAVSYSAGGSQDILRAIVPIDVAGSRAERTLATARAQWLRAEAALMRDNAALVAVHAYYDVLFAQEYVAVLAAAVTDLEEAARVLARREAAGVSSGYESVRLLLACELGRSQHADALAALRAARTQLAGLLGLPVDAWSVGPSPPLLAGDKARALAARGTRNRPAIGIAQRAGQLALDAQSAAKQTWLPTMEFSGGPKHADAGGPGGAGFGYAVGFQLGIPLFDHGQAARAEAQAERTLAVARIRALTRSAEIEAHRALVVYEAACTELARFEAGTGEKVRVLLAAAKAGYAEGERSIVELLDAQRAQTEIAERRLTLFRNAKHAETRLRAAVGDL